MNPREPHDGLSAYFDGELNPSEQQEIQSHLQQSAAAQNELTEIRQLSKEIRSLPKPSAPHDLLANVMNQIEAGIATPEPAKVRSSSFSKVLLEIGSWVAVAAALAVGFAWIVTWVPIDGENSESTVATHSQETPTADQAAPQNFQAPESPPAAVAGNKLAPEMLGSEAELLAQKQAGQGQPAADGLATDQPRPSVASDSFNLRLRDGKGLSGRKMEIEHPGDKRLATDPQVVALLNLADRGPDDVVIVEVTVADASDSIKQLQALLAGNNVSRTNIQPQSTGAFPARGGTGPTVESKDAKPGLFVQSSREQMLEALTAFREQHAGSSLQVKTTLALNAMSLRDENQDRQTRQQMGGGFGGFSARSVPRNRSLPSGQASPRRAVTEKPTAPPQAEKAKTDAQPAESKKTLPVEAARPSFAPDLSKSPQPGMVSPPSANAGKPESYQTIVPNAVLEKLTKRQAAQPGEGKASETPALEPEAKPAEEAEEASSSRPLRVLFLFRESAPKPGSSAAGR